MKRVTYLLDEYTTLPFRNEHGRVDKIVRHSLYRYFDQRQWAEAFLDGGLRFRSLSYYRDYEDKHVRGDRNEGTAIYHPEGGLIVTNHTQGKTITLPFSFQSVANQEEIFVYCLSRSLSDKLRREFKAVVCIEILNTERFCATIEAALPPGAKFPESMGRTRIGHRVEYYQETEGGNRRWALPDVIAVSKLDSYSWQDEYRLVFSLTDALGFEKVATHLVRNGATLAPQPTEHAHYDVKVGSLRDICRVHEFESEPLGKQKQGQTGGPVSQVAGA